MTNLDEKDTGEETGRDGVRHGKNRMTREVDKS